MSFSCVNMTFEGQKINFQKIIFRGLKQGLGPLYDWALLGGMFNVFLFRVLLFPPYVFPRTPYFFFKITLGAFRII